MDEIALLPAMPCPAPHPPASPPASARRRRRTLPLVLVLVLALALVLATAACGHREAPTAPAGEAVFVVLACRGSLHAPEGERFRILLRDPERIAEADELLRSGSLARDVAGGLARGDGGFNSPWSWHLVPDSVRFVEGSTEVCDGCPSFLEADLDYWIDVVGNYCPWTSEVVARER